METDKHTFQWLNFIDRPAFCVKDGKIIAANSAAEDRMFHVGMPVNEFITQSLALYETFKNGSLYFSITAGDTIWNTGVTRTEDYDIFIIEHNTDDEHLQTLALAAKQLRLPLSNIMTTTDNLLSRLNEIDPQTKHTAGQINSGLFQLLRIVSNMTDARNYKNKPISEFETVNLTAVVDEIIEKASALTERSSVSISYTAPDTAIFGLFHAESLERAIYNLLSNALKFAKANSALDIKLVRNGNIASFSVCNTNDEPYDERNIWTRYRRLPSVEDNRHGLGLGMTMIASAASTHGGAVLIDHPTPTETRFTITMEIKNAANSGTVRSPVFRISDYAGGRDRALLEFVELLSSDHYEGIN